ncbi:DUF6463 family protein [Ramlibacter sp. PS4R-6]|uniref:DUF6463 family protein n=1 Tax=Ramlibacter sp. PS4R-6 TaxID=3133438 RepID=UPI00309A3839
MTTTLAWLLFALGVGHIVYAFAKFRVPLLEGLSAGVVGQFGSPEVRRTAFWFTMFGPLLMLSGQVALHAAHAGDLGLFRLVGAYLLAISVVGVVALPKSPFVVGLLISSSIVAASYGFI